MSREYLNNLFNLKNKVALITGASGDLGSACAKALAGAGASVVLSGRSGKKLAAVQSQCRKYKCKTRIIVHELLPDKQLLNHSLIRPIIKEYGRLDILVNAAGIQRRNHFTDFTEKDWDDVINVNLKTVFFLMQLAADEMLKTGQGKIINIASINSLKGFAARNIPAYTASKAGLVALTNNFVHELGGKNIQANCISPGYFKTRMTDSMTASRLREITKRIPCSNLGKPEELITAVIFLASPYSNYVNGINLIISGGFEHN
ncbi:MAG: SDR family oxidoreductase [bacterium]